MKKQRENVPHAGGGKSEIVEKQLLPQQHSGLVGGRQFPCISALLLVSGIHKSTHFHTLPGGKVIKTGRFMRALLNLRGAMYYEYRNIVLSCLC